MLNRVRQFFPALCVLPFLCAGAFAQSGGAAGAAVPQGPRAVESVGAPQGWQRYEIHYAGGLPVRVVFPRQPQAMSDKIPVEGFPPATQYLITADDRKGVYVVSYLVGLPAALAAQPGAREKFFEGLWKGVADGMSAELKRQGVAFAVTPKPPRELTVSGHRAQVQDFTVGSLAGSARAVLDGGNSYVLLHISFADKINDEGNAFLDSFELRPPR